MESIPLFPFVTDNLPCISHVSPIATWQVESIPLFKESHPWEMRSKLAGENFYSATSDDDDKVHVGLVYGLDAATPCTYSATSQLLPDDPRTSVASSAEVERFVQFARGASTLKLTPAQQVAMVETCEAAVSDTMLVEGAQVNGSPHVHLAFAKPLDPPLATPYTASAPHIPPPPYHIYRLPPPCLGLLHP